jgi:hypothetical protein
MGTERRSRWRDCPQERELAAELWFAGSTRCREAQIAESLSRALKTAVQRYFPVAAGSEAQAFAAIAANYPVFELIES